MGLSVSDPAQPGDARSLFVGSLGKHQHRPLLRAGDAGYKQAGITRGGNPGIDHHHVVGVLGGFARVLGEPGNRRVEIGIDAVAAGHDAERTRQSALGDPRIHSLEQQHREQAGTQRAGANPLLVGLVAGQELRLE